MEWDPTSCYIGTHCFLPKKVGTRWFTVKNALTLSMGTKIFQAYDEGPSHLRVPRHFLSPEELEQCSFPIKYIGPTQFSAVHMNPLFDLFDDQRPAFEAIKDSSGILCLACGKGKTVISIHAMCYRKVPAFIVVPTIDLAYQWRERLLEHTDLNPEEIGWAQGKVETWNWRKPVVIGVLKSVAKAGKEQDTGGGFTTDMQAWFGTWIYDECHNLATKEFHYASSLGFGVRWGLSATPYRKDGNEKLFEAHLGKILYTDLNQPNTPVIKFIRTGMSLTREDIDSVTVKNELSLAKLCTLVMEDPGRFKATVALIKAIRESGKVLLVLVERVNSLFQFKEAFPDAGIIHGGVKGSERIKELKKKLVFASRSLAKEGLDKKDINAVLVLYPFTDKGNFIQICGRAQRSTSPRVYFLIDNIGPCIAMQKRLQKLSVEASYPFVRDRFEVTESQELLNAEKLV